MLEKLMQNPYAWAILSICTIISVVFAIYTWIKGKERKEFTCSYASNALIRGGEKQNPSIKVEYDGIEVKNLTSTNIAIWNSGNKVLNQSDMVTGKELTISVEEGKRILAVEIINQSDETNRFELSRRTENIQGIAFDYVDVQEGVVLQVFHDGYNDSIKVGGKIKGGKPIRLNNTYQKEYRKTKNLWVEKLPCLMSGGVSVMITALVIFMLGAIWVPEFEEWVIANQHVPSLFEKIIMTGVMVILDFIWIALTVFLIRNEYQLSVPTKLRKNM